MKAGIIGIILLLLVILGSFPSHGRIVKSVNVTCKTLDRKFRVNLNLSRATATLYLESKPLSNPLTLTFPVCQNESSYFRFAQLKDKRFSLIYNTRQKTAQLFNGENLKCNLKPLAKLNCH